MIKNICIAFFILVAAIALIFGLRIYQHYLSYFNIQKAYQTTMAETKNVIDELYLVVDRKFRGPSVSFCTTYRDRFQQISQTLPKNLKDNRMDKDHVEFVLIDFDPSDSRLKDFIFKNFADDIASGYLKYYQTDKIPSWDFSLAKNTSHYYATKQVVVNLDADNYTGWRGGLYVAHTFEKNKNIFFQQFTISTDGNYGNYGRVSMYKKDFEYLGGYDESLPAPAGYQDADLMSRAESFLKPFHKNSHNQFIANEKDETIKHTKKKSDLTWKEMNALNREYSKNNIKNKKFRANNGIYGIREGVYRIMSAEDRVN